VITNGGQRANAAALAFLACALFGAAPAGAAEALAQTVPVPEPSEEALRYYRSGNALWVVNQIWGLLIPALFLFTGFSARIRNVARRVGRRWFLVIAVYTVIYIALNYLIDFPLDYYQGFVREHAYGLSHQSFGQWLGDSLKALGVTVVMGGLLAWIPYLLLTRSPQRWWLYTGITAVPTLFLILFIGPIWIAPLFDDFGPMQDKTLEASIVELAERAGVEGSRVFEVNKSEDTKTINAYVTGFSDTKRVVLWDTTLHELDREQVLFVMGHELAHYVLGHIWQLLAVFSLLLIVALYGVHRAMGTLTRRFRHRFGFDQPADIASLPLLILLLSLASLVLGPVALAFSRHIEHQADRFGLEITQNNHAAASAFVVLQQENLGNPRPGTWYRLWRASHPVLAARIAFANDYRPWATGAPMQYADHFRPVE
jgi:Zn-dependent protease with chaperone function